MNEFVKILQGFGQKVVKPELKLCVTCHKEPRHVGKSGIVVKYCHQCMNNQSTFMYYKRKAKNENT